MHYFKTFITVAICVVFINCKNSTQTNTSSKPDVLASVMDTTVKPADDFFDYANGGWIKKNPIPADESGWGLFQVIPDENLKRIRDINLEAAQTTAAEGTAEQKIGSFWKAAMNTNKIEQTGIRPLQLFLAKIDSVKDVASLQTTMAQLDEMGVGTAFGLYVGQDAKNSTLEALQLWQAGIGLPEREFYFKTDSTSIGYKKCVRKAHHQDIKYDWRRFF